MNATHEGVYFYKTEEKLYTNIYLVVVTFNIIEKPLETEYHQKRIT